MMKRGFAVAIRDARPQLVIIMQFQQGTLKRIHVTDRDNTPVEPVDDKLGDTTSIAGEHGQALFKGVEKDGPQALVARRIYEKVKGSETISHVGYLANKPQIPKPGCCLTKHGLVPAGTHQHKDNPRLPSCQLDDQLLAFVFIDQCAHMTDNKVTPKSRA